MGLGAQIEAWRLRLSLGAQIEAWRLRSSLGAQIEAWRLRGSPGAQIDAWRLRRVLTHVLRLRLLFFICLYLFVWTSLTAVRHHLRYTDAVSTYQQKLNMEACRVGQSKSATLD